jgi:tryptophan synthase alpha chain
MTALPALPPRIGTRETIGAQRIAKAFMRARAAGRAALIPYVVAGYPDAVTSFEIALAAIDAGADLLEIGLPYSDPLADGATLQRASSAAATERRPPSACRGPARRG